MGYIINNGIAYGGSNNIVVGTYQTGELNSYGIIGELPEGVTLENYVIVGHAMTCSDGTQRINAPSVTVYATPSGIVARATDTLYVNQTIHIAFMRIDV